MPIYEYRCEDCKEVTEAIRRMDDKDNPIGCEHCGSQKTARIHSLFSAGKSSSMPDMQACPPSGCPACPTPGMCGD